MKIRIFLIVALAVILQPVTALAVLIEFEDAALGHHTTHAEKGFLFETVEAYSPGFEIFDGYSELSGNELQNLDSPVALRISAEDNRTFNLLGFDIGHASLQMLSSNSTGGDDFTSIFSVASTFVSNTTSLGFSGPEWSDITHLYLYSYSGLYLDNVSLELVEHAVPEPATLVLLFIGTLIILRVRRRQAANY